MRCISFYYHKRRESGTTLYSFYYVMIFIAELIYRIFFFLDAGECHLDNVAILRLTTDIIETDSSIFLSQPRSNVYRDISYRLFKGVSE